MSTRSTTSSMCDHDSMALEPGRSGDAPDRKRDADHDERSERTSWQCSRGRSRRAGRGTPNVDGEGPNVYRRHTQRAELHIKLT